MNKILKIILQVMGGQQAADEFEKAGGGVKNLVKTVAGLAVLQQAGQWLVQFGQQAFDSAAQVERMGRATENLSKSIGSSGEAMVAGIQSAAGGTISELTAMEAANKAMMLGVVQSQGEMSALAEMATRLGAAMGLDAAASIDNLVTGMGRMSPEILDNLGLTVRAEQAYANYAATLGKTAEQLTEQERKQAFMNATLAAGQVRVADLGPQVDDTATKTKRLGAAWADFSAEFGQLISGPLTSGISLATTFVGKLEEGAEAWQGILGAGGQLDQIQGMQELGASTIATTAELQKLKTQLAEMRDTNVNDALPSEIDAVARKVAELEASLTISHSALVSFSDKSRLAAIESGKAKLALNAEKIAADNLAGSLRGAAAASARYSAEADVIISKQEHAAAVQRWVERDRNERNDAMSTVGVLSYDQVEAAKESVRGGGSIGASIGQSMGDSIADTLRSAVESQIKPTLSEVWSPGGEDARIDEWGRRAATIMTQGLNSEWIPALNAQFGGTDFWQPIQAALASGDTAGAQNLLGNLLTQNPQALWDKELIKQRVLATLQQNNARQDLINTITAELSGQGVAVDAGTVEAAMGVSPMAQPVADSLATGMPAALAEKGIGAGLIDELAKQVGDADEQMLKLAQAIAGGLESKLKSAMSTTGASLLDIITSYVANAVGVELRP